MEDRAPGLDARRGLSTGDCAPAAALAEAPPPLLPASAALAINGMVVAKSASKSKTRPPQLPQPPASARDFLLSRPRGAYTALSVSPSGRAQFWQEHCERLAATLAILCEGDRESEAENEGENGNKQLFPLFRAWHASSERAVPLPLASLVGDALLPSVRAAVSAVRELQREEELEGSSEGEEVVVVAEKDEEPAPSSSSSSSSRCAGPGPVSVVVLLSEPEAGEEEVSEVQRHLEALPLDFSVFAWAGGGGAAVAAAAAAPAAAEVAIPVVPAAAVVGGPRSRPHAKDSSWVRARAPLEAKLEGIVFDETLPSASSSVAKREGLLADSRGRLLEGLVTNVFVVVEDEGEDEGEEEESEAKGGRASALSSRFSLQTAPAESSSSSTESGGGVLDGVMRRAVLEAAEALSLRVALSAPDPRERARWREAFVTSALRGVAAVARLRGGGEFGNETWRLDFESESVPGSVTREIAEALPVVMRRHEVKL